MDVEEGREAIEALLSAVRIDGEDYFGISHTFRESLG